MLTEGNNVAFYFPHKPVLYPFNVLGYTSIVDFVRSNVLNTLVEGIASFGVRAYVTYFTRVSDSEAFLNVGDCLAKGPTSYIGSTYIPRVSNVSMILNTPYSTKLSTSCAFVFNLGSLRLE